MSYKPQSENPNGLHQRYHVEKVYGETDPTAQYFILRIDNRGDDVQWIRACRDALSTLCDSLDDMGHMPELSLQIRDELRRLCRDEPLSPATSGGGDG